MWDPSYLARMRWEEEHIRKSLRRATQPSGLAGARAGLQRLLGSGLPIATTTDPPWSQPEVVRAEPIEDDLRYSAIGGPEILELS